MKIAYGSLCTGYDGLGRGLRLAGIDIAPRWMAEVDPAMSRVLKREHEGIPNVGDIKAAPWHLAPHVQIMSSGDPCQAISIAGRQAGREDPRFLWPWVREAYRAVMPDALFFENVANIVSHDKGHTLAERFAHLREDGYEVRWTVLGACAVGAPHHRHRWYAVAARWRGAGPVPVARRMGGDSAICGAPRGRGRLLLPTPRGDAWGAETSRSERTKTGGTLSDSVALLPTPKATDDSNGGPNQRDGAGNYYLPGVTNLLPTPTVADSRNTRNATANSGAGGPGNAGWTLSDVGHDFRRATASFSTWGRYTDAIALWESITGIPAPAPTEPSPRGGRRLSAALPEWMMGLRPGLLTDELSRPDALKGAGNGVVPLAAAAAWRLLTGCA